MHFQPSASTDDGLGRHPAVRTPAAGHKRGREVQSPSSSPLARLVEQIRRLKLPAVDPATANRLLAGFVIEALRHDERGTLLAIVQQFGWQQASGEFTKTIDLGSFSLLLQKYRYERLQELGSGSYAVVYKARNRETDEVIALKKLRFGFDEQGLPSSTLREISLLKELKHANIVELKDIIYGFGTNNVYVVLECLDCDLRHLLDAERQLGMRQIKSYLRQILLAVNHAHMHCVMHRDLKPQNILVDASHAHVKVADFGLARSFLPPFKAYTDKVVTLWYRAPELLMGVNSYSTGIDMWSVGCIFAEMLTREPLFRAESEIGLLHKIFEALGTPNESVWAGVERLAHYRDNYPQWKAKDWTALVPRLTGDPAGVNLLASMLTYDPEARISAAQALKHPWFDDLNEGGTAGGSGPGSSEAVQNTAGPMGILGGMAAQQGPAAAAAGARPPLMPNVLGVRNRAAQLQQVPQAQHGSLQPQQVLQLHAQLQLQQQQPSLQMQQPQAFQLQQPVLQLQQPALQLPPAHEQALRFQEHVPAAAVAGANMAATAGLQGACRTGQPACPWVSQPPSQHHAASGPSGPAAPMPA